MNWLDHLIRVDEAAAEHLARGFRTWLEAGGTLSLQRCLGLPANPESVRRAIRDGDLQRAAATIEAPSDWQRAGMLAQAAQHFELRRWPCWWDLELPPPNASDLDRHLFFAMRAGGGALPKTQRQIFNVTKGE